MKVHVLKIEPQYYAAIDDEKKKFEIRKNDRNFELNDFVVLICPKLPFIVLEIKYISDYAQQDGYVVFSFERKFSGTDAYKAVIAQALIDSLATIEKLKKGQEK